MATRSRMVLLLAVLALAVFAPPALADDREIGAWRPVDEQEPVSVEFISYLTDESFVDPRAQGQVEWGLVPQQAHCGNDYQVSIRATGWQPGQGAGSLPISDVYVTIICSGPGREQRERVMLDRDGRAKAAFTAPDEPAVQTLRLEVSEPGITVAAPRQVGSYVYRVVWLTEQYEPPTRRGRAAYVDEIIVRGLLQREEVDAQGRPGTYGVTIPDDRIAGLEFGAGRRVRFTAEGATQDGGINIMRAPDGHFSFAVSGEQPFRENIRVEEIPAARGIVFTVPLAEPTWVEFIAADQPHAIALGYKLRPAGASLPREAAPAATGNWLIELGTFEVNKLYDPPHDLLVQAFIPTLRDLPAAGVQGNARVTKGAVAMIATAGLTADTAGIYHNFDGRLPAWFRVEKVGENLIEFSGTGADNTVVFRLIGVAPPWATVIDGGQIAMTLAGAAQPNPVDLNVASRALVTGIFSFSNAPADAAIALKVAVENGRLEAPAANLNGEVMRGGATLREHAVLRPGRDGCFSFSVIRREPGIATVKVYAWTGKWSATMRELVIPVEFTYRRAPAVNVDSTGVGLDFGGGLRIGVPFPTDGSATGSDGGSTAGGEVCPVCHKNPCGCPQ